MGHETWYAAVAVNIFFATVALLLAVVFTLWAFLNRRDRYLLWFAVWSVAAAAVLGIQAALFSMPPSPVTEALLLGRNVGFGVTAALVIPPVVLLAGRRVPWALVAVVAVVYLVRAVVWATTDLLYRHDLDPDGFPVYGPLRTPFSIGPLVLILLILLYYVVRIPGRVDRWSVYAAAASLILVIPGAGLVGHQGARELVSGSWTIPVVVCLGVIGLHRLMHAERARSALLSRQAALAALGRTALQMEGPALGQQVVTEARRVLQRELRRTVRIRPGTGSAGPGTVTVLGRRSAWTAHLGDLAGSRGSSLSEADRDFLLATLRIVAGAADRELVEAELRRSAFEDVLTGLPNRMLMVDRLESAVERARRTGTSVAVLFCDLDEFKEVNDTYGHDAGDALLRSVATALAGAARSADTVARYGGDEFVIVVEGLDPPDDAQQVAERMRRAAAQVPRPGTGEPVRMSVGVAVGGGTITAATLLRDADVAMYAEKRRRSADRPVHDQPVDDQPVDGQPADLPVGEAEPSAEPPPGEPRPPATGGVGPRSAG